MNIKEINEGLTFDDVLLVPAYSEILPVEADTRIVFGFDSARILDQDLEHGCDIGVTRLLVARQRTSVTAQKRQMWRNNLR